MAVAAKRYEILDRETNVATKEFTQLSDNQVYSSAPMATITSIETVYKNEDIVSKVNDSIQELNNAIEDVTSDAFKLVQDSLDSVMESIENMVLPDIVRDAFDALKKLDIFGIRDFLKDLLHVGASFLCNNLDFLKLFMLGFALNRNIIAGLLTALLLSWLDRFCKGFSQEDVNASSPIERLEKVINPRGLVADVTNSFKQFTSMYVDYIESKIEIIKDIPQSIENFTKNALLGDIESSLRNLRTSEVSSDYRQELIRDIEFRLTQHPEGSMEHKNLLHARGELKTIPLIHPERREQSLRYEYLNDRLGSFSTSLVNVDLSSINLFGLSPVELSLHDSLRQYQSNVARDSDLRSRSNNSGSFNDYNFEKVLPPLTPEQNGWVITHWSDYKPHRVHDMHPTTTAMII